MRNCLQGAGRFAWPLPMRTGFLIVFGQMVLYSLCVQAPAPKRGRMSKRNRLLITGLVVAALAVLTGSVMVNRHEPAESYATQGTISTTNYTELPTWETYPDPLAFSVRTLGYLRQMAPSAGLPQFDVSYVAFWPNTSQYCGSNRLGEGADMTSFTYCRQDNLVLINLQSVQALWDEAHNGLYMTVLLARTYAQVKMADRWCGVGAFLRAFVQAGQITGIQALDQIVRYDSYRYDNVIQGYDRGCLN